MSSFIADGAVQRLLRFVIGSGTKTSRTQLPPNFAVLAAPGIARSGYHDGTPSLPSNMNVAKVAT